MSQDINSSSQEIGIPDQSKPESHDPVIGIWDKGVRSGIYRPALGITANVELNILGVPCYVLSRRMSRAKQQIFYSWKTADGRPAKFTFSRTGNNPFPLGEHAFYFDILLAMFCNNFNPHGTLNFRFSDVAKNAGRCAFGRGSRVAIRETIRRYQQCHAEWNYSFRGQCSTWSGSFIVYSNLWDDFGNEIKRTSRNSKNTENWHVIKFHEHIVRSIADKRIRCLLTDILKSGMPAETYVVYRYFKRFSEASDIHRTLEHVKSSLNIVMPDAKFTTWLQDKLNDLMNRGYLEHGLVEKNHVMVRIPTNKTIQTSAAVKKALSSVISFGPKKTKS